MPSEGPRLRDVRMRGFASRTEVKAALEWIDAHARPLDAEPAPLDDATGRTLAEDVIASLDIPGFDRAAMDGYAVRGAETAGASEYNPLTFRLIGHAFPGRPFEGARGEGNEAVRIMTGSPVPRGTDAVVPAEYASENDGQIVITRAFAPGQHVGHRGEDLRAGTAALPAGRRLRPQDVGLVASLGLPRISVIRRPQVRLVVTGNEVKAPGERKSEYEIYDANSYMLRGLVGRDGGVVEKHLRLRDEPEAIRAALADRGADVILVSGGSSVGSEDHAPQIVARLGELPVHGVAMRPSSPAGIGRIADALVFLLPGNPVSCLCAYDFFAGRAIRLRAGRSAHWPHRTVQAIVARKIVSAIGRVDYCRVKVDEGRIEPIALAGASVLSSTTRADGFVIVPAESEGYGPGTEVTVYLYD